MRAIALLLIAVSVCAADVPKIETITMNDGRSFLGELTQTGRHTASLALIDPKGMVIQVSLDDIKERTAADPEAIAAAQEAAKPKAKKAADPNAGRTTKLQDIDAHIADLETRVKALGGELADARLQRQQVIAGLWSDFVMHGDIASVPMSSGTTNAAETERAQHAFRLNGILAQIQIIRQQRLEDPKINEYGWRLMDQDFLDLYKEVKGRLPF